MTTDLNHYRRIAQRYLEAANVPNNNVHESIGFMAYHAFESIGAAWIIRQGQVVPKTHLAKIRHFVAQLRGHRLRFPIGPVAILVELLRNQFLYPWLDQQTAQYDLPENLMDEQEVAHLLRRIRGVIREIEAEI